MEDLTELTELELDPCQPWAVLSDLHANLEAFQAVLAELDGRGVGQAVVLGDLVGYGASPVEVLDLLAERDFPAIVGNHDEMVLGRDRGARTGMVKKRARDAVLWTRDRLTPEHLKRLDALPQAARIGDDVILVHGSLVDPLHCYAYIYDLSLELNLRRLAELDPPAGTVVFFGHTHIPKIFRTVRETFTETPTGPRPIVLDRDAHHFVNPGSVGYPRDGDPRAAALIFHPADRTVELLRVEYDIEAAAGKVEVAGYHLEIAERLRSAR